MAADHAEARPDPVQARIEPVQKVRLEQEHPVRAVATGQDGEVVDFGALTKLLDLALAYALINMVGILAVLEFFQSRQATQEGTQGD